MISGKFGVDKTTIQSRRLFKKTKHHKTKNAMLFSRSRKSNDNIIGTNKETGQIAYKSYCYED